MENKSKHFNFRSELLFPFQFQILGIAFIIIGIVLLPANLPLSLIFILIAALIISSIHGIEFNLEKAQYREYNSFFFIKSGKWKKLTAIQRIFINPSKKSQKFYGRVNLSSVINTREFNAYLKFENGKKIYLCSKKSVELLRAKIDPLAEFLGVEVKDNSI